MRASRVRNGQSPVSGDEEPMTKAADILKAIDLVSNGEAVSVLWRKPRVDAAVDGDVGTVTFPSCT